MIRFTLVSWCQLRRIAVPLRNILWPALSLLVLSLPWANTVLLAEETDGGDKSVTDNSGASLGGLMQQFCFDCHGVDRQEANLRFDTLDWESATDDRQETIERVVRVLREQLMPPGDVSQPTGPQRTRMISLFEARLHRFAQEQHRANPPARSRRLTVEEYNYTMQSLFGVDADFSDLLPADPLSESGYRNNRQRLGLSSLQIEAYLDAARRAVRRYVQFGKLQHSPIRYHIELEDLFYSTAKRYQTRQRAPQPISAQVFAARRAANGQQDVSFVDPLSPRRPGGYSDEESLRAAIPKLHQQYVAIPKRLAMGELIVRVRAAGTADRNGRFPRLRVEAGITLGDGCSMDKRALGERQVTAPPERPQTYEFRIRLEDVPTKGRLREEETFDRLSVFDMDQIFLSNVSCDQHAIFDLGRGGYSDPQTGSAKIADDLEMMANKGVNFLFLDCLEIKMWPGRTANNQPYRWRLHRDQGAAQPEEEQAAVAMFLRKFMDEAYRRPITENELSKKLELFRKLRRRKFTFRESLQETLAAVLVSPTFLFIDLDPPMQHAIPEFTPHQLASRLSYSLWLSPPDQQLAQSANNRSILQPTGLRRQAERLLADRRSRRFLKSFCRQWLRLDKHSNVAVKRAAYPEYDADFGELSIRETVAYFVEVFEANANALDLLDSNYAILNDRLADHYEIPDVNAGTLYRVTLPKDSVRGGLLTQASVMTINSDGADSHPIRRGVWLLDRILNQPPPPPPPNVPEIDQSAPDFRGLTRRQRIELHRQPGSCQTCHRKIDPWGFLFENLDATGQWRTTIQRQDHAGKPTIPIDATARLPNGRKLDGIKTLKRYLRQERSEQFAKSLVHHLLTYMMGRTPNFADRAEVAKIEKRFAASDYRLRTLLLAIVESELFWQ